MKLNVKKILFCGIFVCAALCLCILRGTLSVQTNLNSLVSVNNSDWPINDLTNKFSNVVNIVIKSDNFNDAVAVARDTTDILASDNVPNIKQINTDISLSQTIQKFAEHKNSYVGLEYRKLLENGEFNKITERAVANVAGAMTPTVLSLSDDPFLITTDYIGNIKSANGKWGVRDGFLWQYVAPDHYILISANVNSRDSDDLVRELGFLSKSLRKYNSGNTKVSVSGVPVHTAEMTTTSKLQMGIFSVIALIAAALLNILLFRRVATLVPVVLSLGAGFLAGTLALFLCFNSPHILTFVFGVTLIGLGIDYSLHFMNALLYKSDKSVRKNIMHSFITTVVCFLPLLFSGLSLLQQISVFTIFGLAAIYFGWLAFMPRTIDAKILPVKMPKPVKQKYRSYIIGAIIFAICATLPWVRVQNNLSQLYKPNAELLQAEAQLQKLSGISTSKFLIIRAENLDNALATSEQIKDETRDFFDIETILPSVARQAENQDLIKSLYKSQARKIKSELGLRATPKFIETPPITVSDVRNDSLFGALFDKFVLDDGKYVYLVANVDYDFTTDNKNAIVVSPVEQMTNLMTQYSHEAQRLLVICGAALILLLYWIYGRRATLYLAPSLLAVGLTVAVLTWVGCPITFFHMLSLFIVVGLTLDYSIFHINSNNNREIKPVLFSFLTSLIGFGILSFASFFLIHSMGITLALGLIFGYAISLFLFRR